MKQFQGAGGRAITDCIDIESHQQGNIMANATSPVLTPALTEGVYDCWVDQDMFIGIGPDMSGLTINNGYLLQARNVIPVLVRDGSQIGAITDPAVTTSATLRYHRIL